MDIHQFGDWLASTGPSQAIQATTWAIPAIQSVHILALALVFTLAILLSLRFAGFGLMAEPLEQLATRSARRMWLLLVVLAATGLLLITAEPGRTITNPAFYAKMAMLALVIALTLGLVTGNRGKSRVFGQRKFVVVFGSLLVILLVAGVWLVIAKPHSLTSLGFYATVVVPAIASALVFGLAAGSVDGEKSTVAQKLAAGLSVLLWAGIIFAGRLIAYIESN